MDWVAGICECDAAVDARLGATRQSWGGEVEDGDGHGDGHGEDGGGRRRED